MASHVFTVIPSAVMRVVNRTWLYPFLVWLDTTLGTILGGQPALEVDAVATVTLASLFGSAFTYANGALGVGATLTGSANGAFPTVDGVAPVVGNVYLLTAQASGLQNGPYSLTVLGDGGTAPVLTRITGFDQSAEMKQGSIFGVRSGTVNTGTTWKQTSADAPTVGTTALTFARDPGMVTTNSAQNISGVKTFLFAAWFKINNAADTFASTLGSLATANRAINLPDKAGTISVDDEGTVLRVTATIANAALKTLNATPVSVIPAPAAGLYVEVVSCHARIIFATAAFDSVGATEYLELRYTDASGALLTQNVDPTGFADQASTQDRLVPLKNGTAAFITPAAAAAVVAHIAAGEWYAAAGGGSLKLDLLYRVRTLAV